MLLPHHSFEKDADGICRVEFNSLVEMFNVGNSSGEARDKRNAKEADEQAGYSEYSGTRLAEVLKTFSDPPQDAIFKVEEIRAGVEGSSEQLVGRKRKRRYNLEDGDEPDPEQVVLRDPNCWELIEHKTVSKSVIRIGVNVALNAGGSKEKLMYRGGAVAALVDVLSASGHSVELVMFNCIAGVTEDGLTGVMKVYVKKADMPVDLPSITYALTTPGFYRTAVMAAEFRCWSSSLSGRWGWCCAIPEADQKDMDIVFDANITSKEAAIEAVSKYATAFTTH